MYVDNRFLSFIAFPSARLHQPRPGAWPMPEVRIRKKLTTVEEILHEGGPVASTPLRRAAVLAVIHNPFAGHYVETIAGFMDDLTTLVFEMSRACIAVQVGDLT